MEGAVKVEYLGTYSYTFYNYNILHTLQHVT
jgi:hypothetical protein